MAKLSDKEIEFLIETSGSPAVVKVLAEEVKQLRAALSQIALYTDKSECFEVADMAIAALDASAA